MNLHILVISHYFWPENFRINDLVNELSKRGNTVTVLTGIPNYHTGNVPKNYLSSPEKFNKYFGANILRIPIITRKKGTFRQFMNYLSFVINALLFGTWKLRNIKPDVIFVFQPSPGTIGIPAIWFSKIKKSPIVFWSLDLWPETLSAVGVIKSKILLSFVGLMMQFIYNNCSCVLGQSKSFLVNIKKKCADISKVHYFPNWSEDLFLQNNKIFAPEIPKWKNGFTIMFTGNIGEAQDMSSILDAITYLKKNFQIRWVFVGDGPKLNWLKKELLKRNLNENVLLTGRFPLERMPEFLCHANAVLVSLKSDTVFSMTIPGKIQAYLLSGIPIIGMLDGEGARVIEESNSGLVSKAGNGILLAKNILKMSKFSKNSLKTMGKNGKTYAMKNFCKKKLIDKLENHLNEATNSYKI